MMKSTTMTETIGCDVADPRLPPPQDRETAFEKPRGVSKIEVRKGYAQVHVSGLSTPLMTSRIAVLKAISEAGVNIDFLKLTPDGLSFLVNMAHSDAAHSTLATANARFEVRKNRSIVLVHAVNMRDEEGLIAEIVHAAIGSGARVDHIGDMHDRLLMIVDDDHATQIEREIRRRWSDASPK